MIGRPPGLRRLDPVKPELGKIECIDEGVDHSNWIVLVDPVFQTAGKQRPHYRRPLVIGAAAGVFLVTALLFFLVGCAWLLYFELPIGNQFTYFYGFFAMAIILVVLGVIAGLVAARALRSSAPPTPDMAIEQARKIRETVAASSGGEESNA